MSEHENSAPGAARRYRPSRRISPTAEQSGPSTALNEQFLGLAVAYGNTLLFIGYEVNGLVEVTVYPRYRFSSDDRVQGHIGYVRAPLGTPWETILEEVEAIFVQAERNYRSAVTLRSAQLRAHGSRYEAAYDTITNTFRESWHGFALRLRREQPVVKNGVTFQGAPPGPVLARWRGEIYTVQVYPTGSVLVLTGDKRDVMRDA